MTNLAVGDIVTNEDLNIEGTITSLDETNVTIQWKDGAKLVEEVVPLDELSPALMNKYVKKAGAQAGKAKDKKGYDAYLGPGETEKDDDVINKREKGIATAKKRLGGNYKPSLMNRIRGEEVEAEGDEQINELSGKVIRSYDEKVLRGWMKKAKEKEKKGKAYNEENEMNEDTAALASLKPNSNPAPENPKSKLEVMKSIMGSIAKMEDNDAVAFFHKAMADHVNFGSKDMPDNSGKNKESVSMHPSDAVKESIKEDVAKLFEGAEVTEDFKEKTTTLFEAALSARMAIFEAELEDEANKIFEEKVMELEGEFGNAIDEIDEQVESYLDYVANKWLEENQIAIESSLRSDLTQEFIDGLKVLFTEHYIDIPEEKIDVVNELQEQVNELQAHLSEAIEETVKLRDIISEVTAEEAFEEIAEGLALTEVEKFRTLAEGVDFEGDVDKFREKLKLIREAHFTKAKRPTAKLNDEFSGNEKTLTEEVDPRVARYVASLSKSNIR
jgi:hypothetical protein